MSCIKFWAGNPTTITFKFSNEFIDGTDFIISAFNKEGKLLFTDRYSNGNITSEGNNEYTLNIAGSQTTNFIGLVIWSCKVGNLNLGFVNGSTYIETTWEKPLDIGIL